MHMGLKFPSELWETTFSCLSPHLPPEHGAAFLQEQHGAGAWGSLPLYLRNGSIACFSHCCVPQPRAGTHYILWSESCWINDFQSTRTAPAVSGWQVFAAALLHCLGTQTSTRVPGCRQNLG